MSVMPGAVRWSRPSPARATLKVIGTLHRLLYQFTGGRMGGALRGGPVLLLTTTGRKTGQERTWPLCYVPASGDELVLVASAGGAPRHPAWYLNLRVEPRVSIRLGEGSRKMVARTAEESERAWLWERILRRYPVVAGYQRKCSREIPVVILRAATRQDVEGAEGMTMDSTGARSLSRGENFYPPRTMPLRPPRHTIEGDSMKGAGSEQIDRACGTD